MAFNTGYPQYNNNFTGSSLTFTLPLYQTGTYAPTMMASGGGGGISGNPSLNLEEVEAVKKLLHDRKTGSQMRTATRVYQRDMFTITDRNEERLFKPLLPANLYIHEDNHIEWLKGRTRSVCSRIAWAKETFSQ